MNTERIAGANTWNDRITRLVNEKYPACEQAAQHKMGLVREVWTSVGDPVSESRDEWKCIYCGLLVNFPTLKRFVRWAELGEMGNESDFAGQGPVLVHNRSILDW